MRRFTEPVVLSIAFLLAAVLQVRAQDAVPPTQTGRICATPDSADAPSGPEISVVDVNFVGSLQLSLTDQEKIADSLKHLSGAKSLDEVTDEAAERARTEWQNRGYFAVLAEGETRTLTGNSIGQRVALSIHVDEGPQYRLGGIVFKHNTAVSDEGTMRRLFPIQDGDIFNREAIATGLSRLRSAFGDLGYINFTSLPNATIDDENKLVFLDIDVDQGKLFHLSDFEVLTPEESMRKKLLKTFPINPGEVYVDSKVESFWREFSIDAFLVRRHLNEQAGTVAITVDLRPCAN